MQLNVGSVLSGIFRFDPADLAKALVTQATAEFSRPILSEAFQKMKVDGRRKLAGKLRKLSDALDQGECDAAAAVGADIIDDIRL